MDDSSAIQELSKKKADRLRRQRELRSIQAQQLEEIKIAEEEEARADKHISHVTMDAIVDSALREKVVNYRKSATTLELRIEEMLGEVSKKPDGMMSEASWSREEVTAMLNTLSDDTTQSIIKAADLLVIYFNPLIYFLITYVL